MRKKRNETEKILLTSVLVLAIVAASVFTVFAEDTAESQGTASDLLSSLFGDDGVLSGLMSEGTDALEGITSEGSDLESSDALSGLLGSIQDGGEGFNLDALGDLFSQDTEVSEDGESSGLNLGDLNLGDLNLGDLNLGDLNLGDLNLGDLNLGDLLGGLLGDSGSGEAGEEEIDFSSFGALIEARQQINEAEKEYMLELNADRLMPGEIQIVSSEFIWQDENFDVEDEETQEISKLTQFNYNMNEEGQLEHVSGIELVCLFTLTKGEDGNYVVTDAELCDEGENYMPSIVALCEKVGAPVDQCVEELDRTEMDVLFDLTNYMADHPEVTAIELNGEMMTVDDINNLIREISAKLQEKYPDEEEYE